MTIRCDYWTTGGGHSWGKGDHVSCPVEGGRAGGFMCGGARGCPVQ